MPCHLTGFFLFEAYGRKGHEMEVKVKVLEVSFEIPEEYVERIMDALTSIGLEKEYEDWDEDCEKDVDWEAVWYGIDENYPETVIKCRPLTLDEIDAVEADIERKCINKVNERFEKNS